MRLASLLLLALSPALLADPDSACLSVSGSISASLINPPAVASPTIVLGGVSGDLRGAVNAFVTSQMPDANGTVLLKLQHVFVTEQGDSITTQDNAVLTPVPGKQSVFQMSTDYKIVGGTGRFRDASGTLQNHGEADLGRGQFTLRYSGQVCPGKN